jgi:hypothetical protein
MTRLLDVTLIGALQPIAIIAFAVAFLGEVVQRSNIGRAVVAIGATIVVALAASSTGTWSLSGDLVAVASLFLNAGWFLYGRVLRTNFSIDPFAFMFATLTCAAILITPIALIAHGSLAISGRGVFFATCVMLAGTTAHVLMVWAHRYIPSRSSDRRSWLARSGASCAVPNSNTRNTTYRILVRRHKTRRSILRLDGSGR